MPLTSRLTIDIGDREGAEKLYLALLPEIRSNKSRAATLTMEREGSRLVISIKSSTITATRALLNSYIRWISISLDVMRMKGA